MGLVSRAGMTDLLAYGRLFVTNSHASSVENVAMTMASNSADDTTTVSFPIARMTTLLLPELVRRVPGVGTDANINIVLVAESDLLLTCCNISMKVKRATWLIVGLRTHDAPNYIDGTDQQNHAPVLTDNWRSKGISPLSLSGRPPSLSARNLPSYLDRGSVRDSLSLGTGEGCHSGLAWPGSKSYKGSRFGGCHGHPILRRGAFSS